MGKCETGKKVYPENKLVLIGMTQDLFQFLCEFISYVRSHRGASRTNDRARVVSKCSVLSHVNTS